MQTGARRLLIAVGCAIFVLPGVAHAQYLDPGAGSMIIQVVIALGVGIAATFKIPRVA
jgi:hypothetical protein